MTIFQKYYLKEFFRYFAIILLTFTSITIIAEFFDKAPEFYREKPPVILIIKYLLFQTPRSLLYALPFTSLFSILITIGISSKWSETIAIKASGCSTRKLFSSFLILGIIITLLALFIGETIVPAATSKAAWIRKVQILKESPRISHREDALWLKGLDGSLVRIAGFVEDESKILKTSIFSFNSSFGLEQRIEADSAEWINGKWDLKNVTIFNFQNNTSMKLVSLTTSAIEEPKIFREEIKTPDEMNFMELYTYYDRLENAGFKSVKNLVRLYEKLAYPTINFVMIIFGIALALNAKWGGGIKAAGLGVIASTIYWLIYSISISLGNTGILQPWLAPWISPALFGIVGCYLYLQIQE